MLIVRLLKLWNSFISWQTNIPAGLQPVCTYGSTDLWVAAGDLPFHWAVHIDLYKRAVVNGEPAPWSTPGSPSNSPSAGHTNSERGLVNLSHHSQSLLSTTASRLLTCDMLWWSLAKSKMSSVCWSMADRPKKNTPTPTHTHAALTEGK